MNNSMLNIDSFSSSEEDSKEKIETKLRSEESRIVKIIEALQEIQKSRSWEILKDEVFEPLTSLLEKELKIEARKDNVDPQKLNRISGELKWAERYSDLAKLENNYRVQLQNIRIKLYGKESE